MKENNLHNSLDDVFRFFSTEQLSDAIAFFTKKLQELQDNHIRILQELEINEKSIIRNNKYLEHCMSLAQKKINEELTTIGTF